MKKILIIYSLAFLCLFTSCGNDNSAVPTLILNYDINGTLLATDAGAGRDPKCAYITLLAKIVEVEVGTDGKITQLKMADGKTHYFDYLKAIVAGRLMLSERKAADSQGLSYYGYFLKSIVPGADAKANISYYEYIKSVMKPSVGMSKEEQEKIKKDRDDKVCDFIKDFDDASGGDLANALVLMQDTHKKLEDLFESFFELLKFLDQKKNPYHLVLRSFGTDLDDIVGKIEQKLSVNFSKAFFFNNKLNMLAKTAQVLNPKYKLIDDIPIGAVEGTIKDANEIKDILDNTRFLAIRDQYWPWANNKESWQYGKIFLSSTKNSLGEPILPIFLDDNSELNFKKNNVVRPVKIVQGNMVLDDNPDVLVGSQVFKVDTLFAMMHKKYFIELVESSLAQFVH